MNNRIENKLDITFSLGQNNFKRIALGYICPYCGLKNGHPIGSGSEEHFVVHPGVSFVLRCSNCGKDFRLNCVEEKEER